MSYFVSSEHHVLETSKLLAYIRTFFGSSSSNTDNQVFGSFMSGSNMICLFVIAFLGYYVVFCIYVFLEIN